MDGWTNKETDQLMDEQQPRRSDQWMKRVMDKLMGLMMEGQIAF